MFLTVALLWKLLAVFVGSAISDLLVVQYTQAAAAGRRLRTAALSGIVALINTGILAGLIVYHEELGFAAVPAIALGAVAGTAAGLRKKC